MRFLFFIVGLFYSFIFYFFYTFSINKDIFLKNIDNFRNIKILGITDPIIFSGNNELIIQSLSGNLLIESISFLVLSFFLFFLFTSKTQKEKKDNQIEKEVVKNNLFTPDLFKTLLSKLSYYFGFILFYISIYLITSNFESIKFSYFIFIINIIIFLFAYLSNYSSISRDFLKVNSIIFSLGYTFSYLYIIITKHDIFSFVDFLNSIFVVFTFLMIMYFDKFVKRQNHFDKDIIIHYSVYLVVFVLFYFYKLIPNYSVFFYISLLFGIFGVIWFNIFPRIKLFLSDKAILKYIGINFTYISIISGIVCLVLNFNILVFLLLIFLGIYNLLIHKKYTNYFSLISGLLSIIFILIYTILKLDLFSFKDFGFIIILLVISYLLVILTYFIKVKYYLDYYIIHFFSYILNAIGLILFLIFIDFEILHIGVILLLESMYFFGSYHRLTQKN